MCMYVQLYTHSLKLKLCDLNLIVSNESFVVIVRKWYVSNALKFNQNSSLLFTKTLQWKCLSTKTLIG